MVGLGVQGMKADDVLVVAGSRAAMSALGGVREKHQRPHPGRGKSTSPTRRKLEPVFENSVSKICFRLL